MLQDENRRLMARMDAMRQELERKQQRHNPSQKRGDPRQADQDCDRKERRIVIDIRPQNRAADEDSIQIRQRDGRQKSRERFATLQCESQQYSLPLESEPRRIRSAYKSQNSSYDLGDSRARSSILGIPSSSKAAQKPRGKAPMHTQPQEIPGPEHYEEEEEQRRIAEIAEVSARAENALPEKDRRSVSQVPPEGTENRSRLDEENHDSVYGTDAGNKLLSPAEGTSHAF